MFIEKSAICQSLDLYHLSNQTFIAMGFLAGCLLFPRNIEYAILGEESLQEFFLGGITGTILGSLTIGITESVLENLHGTYCNLD